MKHRLAKTSDPAFTSSRYAPPAARGENQRLPGDPKAEDRDTPAEQKIAFQKPEGEDSRIAKSESNQSRTR